MVRSTETIIQELKQQFAFLVTDPRILGIIVYGSVVSGDHHDSSDTDICIVAPQQDKYAIYHTCIKGLKGDIDKLDIRFYEELPLLIRADIIEKGLILYTRNLGELTEYFFFSTRLELEDFKFSMKYCQ